MDIFQEYRVFLLVSSDEVISEITDIIEPLRGWKKRTSLEKNMYGYLSNTRKQVLCLETPSYKYGKSRIKGVIWSWVDDKSLDVFNIIPLSGTQFDPLQYNFILNRFNDEVIKNLPAKCYSRIEMTKPIFDMEERIGGKAFEALRAFSTSANKSTGNSHPNDLKIWYQFIILAFHNDANLSPDQLMQWLVNDGWGEDIATKLSLEFEYSFALLKEYESDR